QCDLRQRPRERLCAVEEAGQQRSRARGLSRFRSVRGNCLVAHAAQPHGHRTGSAGRNRLAQRRDRDGGRVREARKNTRPRTRSLHARAAVTAFSRSHEGPLYAVSGLRACEKIRRLNAELAEHAEKSTKHFFSAASAETIASSAGSNLTTELSLRVRPLATLNPAAMTNAADIASLVIQPHSNKCRNAGTGRSRLSRSMALAAPTVV